MCLYVICNGYWDFSNKYMLLKVLINKPITLCMSILMAMVIKSHTIGPVACVRPALPSDSDPGVTGEPS